jgi:TolA-binding protein
MRRHARFGVALVAAWILVGPPRGAGAQAGRLTGLVRDPDGQPVKGATVVAGNARAQPSTFTTTTDERGRFVMIGLQGGVWRFLASAPGYAVELLEIDVSALKRNAPVEIRLTPAPGAPPWLAGTSVKEVQANLQAADALFEGGQWEAAIAAYRAIVAKTPALTAVSLRIGDAYRAMKNYDAAIAAYRGLLDANPGNERALVATAETQVEKGDLQAATDLLEGAASAPAAGRDVFYMLGEVRFAAGQLAEAADAYRRAAALDPAWIKATYTLGVVAWKQGDRDTARRLLEQVIADSPDSPEASEARLVVEQLKK